MNSKQLSRIADALEAIAGNQSELLAVMKGSVAKSNQDLSTHASMFGEMRELIEPLLAGAVAKMEARSPQVETPDKPTLAPPPIVAERNGIRILAAQPTEVEVTG